MPQESKEEFVQRRAASNVREGKEYDSAMNSLWNAFYDTDKSADRDVFMSRQDTVDCITWINDLIEYANRGVAS